MVGDLPLAILQYIDEAVACFRSAAIGKAEGVEACILQHVAADQDFPLAHLALGSLIQKVAEVIHDAVVVCAGLIGERG